MTALVLPAIQAGDDDGYIPGVCNIGTAETRMRRVWAGVFIAITAIAFAYLLWADLSPAWMLLLFLPAMGAGVTWLQARNRFCVNFGVAGRYNFGRVGKTSRIADDEAHRRDLAKVREMFFQGAAIAAVVTAAAFVVALLV